MEKIKDASGVTPFAIGDNQFMKMFIPVDSIYPPYSCFVKGISQPIHENETRFMAWQESTWKDIERAFGMLQQTLQFVACPIYMFDLMAIGDRMKACLILHNMCVSDRVMEGDVHALYDPANTVEVGERLPRTEAGNHEEAFPAIGIRNIPREDNIASIAQRWASLQDIDKHYRLQDALIKSI